MNGAGIPRPERLLPPSGSGKPETARWRLQPNVKIEHTRERPVSRARGV
jgi:hypothetical protein